MKDLSQCRILVVDDTRSNVDILVEALRHDYQLSVALNGELALKSVARAVPDLVLLDIMMPGMDGYEVCRRLRLMPEMTDVPIVFLSALDQAPKKAQGFEVGANDYVTKPFETLEVQARVRSLLKAKAYSDSVKEQLAADLRIAREIQRGMIPQEFSALERLFGVEVACALEPAREVGGDLFGAFAVENKRLVLFMGDVSGKGIPASLFMVRADTLIRVLARQIREPERILQTLNDELSADNPSGMFVTLVCAVFEPATRRLTLANGGQTSPVLLRPGEMPRRIAPQPLATASPGQTSENPVRCRSPLSLSFPAATHRQRSELEGENRREKASSCTIPESISGPAQWGTALGLEPGLSFERVEFTLQPSDTLLFYTDGVTEAFNPDGDCYGNARLLSLLSRDSWENPLALANRILAEVRAFAHGGPQSDDLALLVMRLSLTIPQTSRSATSTTSELTDAPNPPVFKETPGAADSESGATCATAPAPNCTPPTVTLELQATPEQVMRGVETLELFCREQHVPESLVFGLKLALEETCSNIVNHAYRKDTRHRFTVVLKRLGDRILMETRDQGPPFNPSQAPLPNGTAEMAECSVGGLGIYLARQYLDDLAYAREGDQNVLRMSRRLPNCNPHEDLPH